jgi:hypothetical protein
VYGRGQQRKPAGPTGDDPKDLVTAALISARTAEGVDAGKQKKLSKLISLVYKVRACQAVPADGPGREHF